MTEEQAPRGLSDEELECRVDELRTYLGFSTCHTEDCARYQLGETKCDCGLPKFMGAVRDLILSHRALRAKVEELEGESRDNADTATAFHQRARRAESERDTLREEVELRKQEIKDRDGTIRAAAAEVERLKADLERQSRLRGYADTGVMNERVEEQNRALREEVERLNQQAESAETRNTLLAEDLVKANEMMKRLRVSHGCKHADKPGWGIAAHEYQEAVERALTADAALEDTIKSLGAAELEVERLKAERDRLEQHFVKPLLDDDEARDVETLEFWRQDYQHAYEMLAKVEDHVRRAERAEEQNRALRARLSVYESVIEIDEDGNVSPSGAASILRRAALGEKP